MGLARSGWQMPLAVLAIEWNWRLPRQQWKWGKCNQESGFQKAGHEEFTQKLPPVIRADWNTKGSTVKNLEPRFQTELLSVCTPAVCSLNKTPVLMQGLVTFPSAHMHISGFRDLTEILLAGWIPVFQLQLHTAVFRDREMLTWFWEFQQYLDPWHFTQFYFRVVCDVDHKFESKIFGLLSFQKVDQTLEFRSKYLQF